MSAFRVGSSDDMVVDGQGVDPPTEEWMQRAQNPDGRAETGVPESETDGIFENAPAKRQKVFMSCCTPTALHMQNLAHKCTQRRASLPERQKYSCTSASRTIHEPY